VGAAYTQELLDRTTAYGQQPLKERRSPAGLAELTSLYSAITGHEVGTCRQCQYSDYLAALTNYSRAATRFLHPEIMSDSKYAIAPGLENETFVHESYGKVVTAENLEDKDVEFFKSKGLGASFVLKSKKEAEAAAGDDAAKVSDAESKAKDEATASKTALKTEKDAHTATKKDLATSQKEVVRLTKALADAQAALGKATATPVADAPPTAPPVDPGATA
jgi:hypothetical protein